jgi:hypothetical protein
MPPRYGWRQPVIQVRSFSGLRIALVSQIAIINAFNRLNVILQQPAGDYQPGQFG